MAQSSADDAPKNLALREIVLDANKLATKRSELDNLRRPDAMEWAQNKAFYRGQQWIFPHPVTGDIQAYGTDDGDKPRYKVRLTSNQITPGVTGIVAQKTKTRPTIRAVPDSGSDRDVKAAELAERLYEYWWRDFALDSKLVTALTNAEISQGWWLITWDAQAGKPFRVMVNPNTGQPETDQRLEDIYREEFTQLARQQGMDPAQVISQFEQTLYLGDISVRALDGNQVWTDPTAANFEDANYAIVKLPMDVDMIEARWKVRVTPDSVTGESRPSLAYSRGKEDSRPKNVRNVYCGYFRPTPALPNGRYVYWIEGPNQILDQGNWDSPTKDLPLVHFPGIERPGSVIDEPRTTFARPLQKELNLAISKVAMYRNLTLKPQMIAPRGSLRQRITDEPGAVWEYDAMAGISPPEWRPVPTLPAYIFETIMDIQARLDRVFNRTPTERSQLPARTDSGQLLDLMQEAVADQLSPEIRRMEIALARAGKLMASLAKKYYIETRLLKIFGDGGSVRTQKFLNSDLEGGYTFHAEAGSGLPRTRAGQVQQIRELIEMQVLSPQDALPYLPIAGLKSVQMKLMADEDYAYRKIDALIKGEPLNVPAAMAAVQQVQTGQNPTTGAMFESPEEAQAYVEQAMLQPSPFENWGKSMDVLRTHMLGLEFANYPLETQQRFLTHYEALRSALMSMPSQIEPIKTTMRLQGTVGPTVAADILRHNGIWTATPETMSEPPLETWVTDSVDDPNKSEAGNEHLTTAEQMLTMMQASDQHDTKQAKAAHEVALAEHRVEASHLDHSRAEELHQERIQAMRDQRANANADAQAKRRQAAIDAVHRRRQAAAKPKAGSPSG